MAYVFQIIEEQFVEKVDLTYFSSEGKDVDEWPLSDEIKAVVKKNPVEGIIDFEEHKNVIIDRFHNQEFQLVEITRSLLGRAPEPGQLLARSFFPSEQIVAERANRIRAE